MPINVSFDIFSDHLVDNMGAVKLFFICAFLSISTKALYLSSTPVHLPDDYNETSALPLAVTVEDNEAGSKEDDFNEILKSNFYLKHLVNQPDVEELKIEGSIEVSSSHDDKARIVVEDNVNKTMEIKEDFMDIIIFPDSDIIIPPKTRTVNKTIDSNTVAKNVTTATEVPQLENVTGEAVKTNVSDPDLLNRFGLSLSDKEYLLVPIGSLSQKTVAVTAPTQQGYNQVLQPNLGSQQPAGILYSNVQNLLSYPRSNQATAVHFPDQNQVLPQSNVNYNSGYHTNNANQNFLTPQPQVNVNNNLDNKYGTSPGYVQQNLNTNLNNNYATNPGYVQNVNTNLNNNYGPLMQAQDSVHFPNNGQNSAPGYALTNVNTNLNNNFVKPLPSLSNNGVQQYNIPTQGYQPTSNQIYGIPIQSTNIQLQNPGNQQLLIEPSSYQGTSSGYQTVTPAANQGNQLYLLAPAANYLLVSVPGGSSVQGLQGYLIVPRSSLNMGSS